MIESETNSGNDLTFSRPFAAKTRDEINTAVATAANWAETQVKELRDKHGSQGSGHLKDDLTTAAASALVWGKSRLDEIEKKRRELEAKKEKDK